MPASIPFEFSRPMLLLLLFPAVPVLVWFYVRSLSDFPRPQRLASLLIRSCIVLLLLWALAGFTIMTTTQDRFFVFLIDQSTSIGENGRQRIDEYVQRAIQLTEGDRVAFLPTRTPQCARPRQCAPGGAVRLARERIA